MTEVLVTSERGLWLHGNIFFILSKLALFACLKMAETKNVERIRAATNSCRFGNKKSFKLSERSCLLAFKL